MLESIRQMTQTWLAKVILAVITVPFALWGIESYVRSDPKQETIAQVGDVKITQLEFNEAVKNQLEQFKRQFGNQVDASIMDTPEMRKNVLNQIVDDRLFAVAAKNTGVTVSDAMLRDRIANEPSFQEDGKFSPSRYETFLRAQGYGATTFEALLKKDIERSQFAGSISNTAIVPKTSVVAFLKAAEQTRDVAMVNILPDTFLAQVTIKPEQIKAYYDSNTKEFTIPDQARVEYVELSADALAPSVQVAAEEVKAFYESNNTRYMQPEQRKASHILINAAKDAKDADKAAAKAKADDLYAQLKKNPKLFAELAKNNSQDTGSAVAGGDLGFFGKGAMVKPFEDAAFGAKKGDLLPPVLSDFGYHIILVTDVKEAKGKSLAEVTPEIEGELKKQRAKLKFTEIAEKFTNAAYEQSSSLKAAADVAGLPVKQSPWISKGNPTFPPFNNPKLIGAVFADEVFKNKRNTEAVETAPSTLVVARLLESKPSVLRPYAEVEKQISARLAREEAGKLAKKDGEAKLAALREGKAVDVKWPAMLAVGRSNPGGLPQPVIEAAMKADSTKLPVYVGTDNPGGGYSLIQVAKVNEPPATDEAKVGQARQRLLQAVTQGEVLGVLAVAKTKVDVTIAKDALEKKADK